jgi:hypothetical protein
MSATIDDRKPVQIRTYREIVAAYARMGKEAIYGKGGVWVKGEGFRPYQTALNETRGYRARA